MMPMKTRPQRRQIETSAGRVDALGEVDLLSYKKVGVICSQKCSGDVILKSYDFARLVRGCGIAIVSGFHSTVERDCLAILLRGSDPIVICQGHRLSTTRLPGQWQKAIVTGRLLLLSPFSERDKRVTAELAAERNRFVAAISDILLIPYAAQGGKTEALALELLSRGKRVYTFQRGGHVKLISNGAITVSPEFLVSSLGGSWEGILDAAHHKS
jgi:predicted Rossmann fold nucleotide-binding protein DprA/Smf involved in DNA uptake